MTLERIEPDHRTTLAPQDIQGRAGTVAATNWCWHGIVESRLFITLSVNWVMGNGLPGFEEYDHWEISIRGKPSIDNAMNLVEPEPGKETYGVTGSVINAVPEVCSVHPGIFHIPVFAWYRRRF